MTNDIKHIFKINSNFFWKNIQIFPKESLKITNGGDIKATLGEIGFIIDDTLPDNTIIYDNKHLN